MKTFIREISKIIMFTILWGIPLLVAKHFDSPKYLWLFVVSGIFTSSMFSHYEELESFEQDIEEEPTNE